MRILQSFLKALAYRCGFSLRRLRPASRLTGNEGNHTGRVRPLLYCIDPYEDFDASNWPDDASGWGSDSPAFGELVEAVRPSRLIEIGTWKGGSAITLARHLDRHRYRQTELSPAGRA